MLSQNKIKYLISLQNKKNRENTNIFVAEGDKICQEIIDAENLKIENIFATEKWIAANEKSLQKHRNILLEITENELKKISSLSTPNQVLITASKPTFLINNNDLQDDIVLYLDGIQDPGNMGTILRNADWFGIKYVFCSDTCVDIYNPKVIQASMGAFLRINSQEIDLQTIININSTIPVYGTLLEGENIYEKKLTKNGIIVIGSEGKGISEKNLLLVTEKIKIPSYGKGAESLNAAVATGIVCSIFRNTL